MTTTIAVSEQTREMLKSIGHKGDTYDSIIQKVLELARKQMFFERQKRILEGEEFVGLEAV